jgi:hypothetical protein
MKQDYQYPRDMQDRHRMLVQPPLVVPRVSWFVRLFGRV